jgi:hypothetical protein
MRCACVAIIGKNVRASRSSLSRALCIYSADLQNNPLYIKSFDETESDLKFHYIVHTSLDIVAEKGRPVLVHNATLCTFVCRASLIDPI